MSVCKYRQCSATPFLAITQYVLIPLILVVMRHLVLTLSRLPFCRGSGAKEDFIATSFIAPAMSDVLAIGASDRTVSAIVAMRA